MNFKEAYEEMLKGKKIKRPGFDGYWYIEQSNILKLELGEVVEVPFNTWTMIHMSSNDWEVVEENKVWKPKEGEKYFTIDYDGTILNLVVRENVTDYDEINLGNCFKTKKEAEHMAEKLKVINELKNFALENNEKEINWKNDTQKYAVLYDYLCQKIKIDYWNYMRHIPFNIYFTSREIAQKAIEAIGEDRIKKYYFDVEE